MKEFCMIERHGDDDISFYYVEMKDEDHEGIDAILKKYETDGFSCRGRISATVDFLGNILKDSDALMELAAGLE